MFQLEINCPPEEDFVKGYENLLAITGRRPEVPAGGSSYNAIYFDTEEEAAAAGRKIEAAYPKWKVTIHGQA